MPRPRPARRYGLGALVHGYRTEGDALAFIRDIVRIGGHEQARCFALDEEETDGKVPRIAEGVELVKRALED